MTDAAVTDYQDHGNVAPADQAYVNVGRPADQKVEHASGGPTHPGVTHPQQPSFPRPFGLTPTAVEHLVEQKVVHTYQGLGHLVDELRGERGETVEPTAGEQGQDAGEQDAGSTQ